MSAKDKWIRRFSVDETAKHLSGFTIYKITSVLFPLRSPEAVTSVSVWKRYSDVQRLHKSMKAMHAGLHLPGTFPALPRYSFFKRFQKEVIDERAKTIKALLEFIAEHRMLFTSTDFVNFLQTGYPQPVKKPSGVIDSIRCSLHLPLEETQPLEYQTDDEDARTPDAVHAELRAHGNDETDFISQIPIYEAAEVEIRESPKHTHSSFESFSSIESIDSDLYDELNKLTIDKSRPSIRRMLPDLINFDVPSTSKFEDYHTMPRMKTGNTDETSSLNSNLESSSLCDLERRSGSKLSVCSMRSVLSLSNVESKTRTEDSYVFEAGYMLNLAARCEDIGDYQRAFECYKSGIEKMLIGVQSDTDCHRKALIKEKTNKYLSYAEDIYKKHLSDAERSLLPVQEGDTRTTLHCPIPISMLKRPYDELGLYTVLAVLGSSLMLVMHKNDKNCYAMKVIQKIPNNLTEFDEYFLQRTSETRTPVLPTVIPYMVPLHAFVETNNLIFLILSYAAGENLFDYIKKYTKSQPTTSRHVNLENVFTEPKTKVDAENNLRSNVSVDVNVDNENVDNKNVDNRNVDEIVLKSQKLLLNVDKVLAEEIVVTDKDVYETRSTDKVHAPASAPVHAHVGAGTGTCALPGGAVARWGAEMLTALESLHNCGVVVRDLNPSNILLGDRGQIIVTYLYSYPGIVTARPGARAHPGRTVYVAPELRHTVIRCADEGTEHMCDYWSYGAIMYQLICGVPLSHHHGDVFTSHTILRVPEGVSVESESLLTQLLAYDPAERLGAGGVEEIKRHPYFKAVDWQSVYDTWIVPD